jgi:hypothetical protein
MSESKTSQRYWPLRSRSRERSPALLTITKLLRCSLINFGYQADMLAIYPPNGAADAKDRSWMETKNCCSK